MDFELDQGLDEEDFNFSAQVERVFESVKNVSAMVNRHVEKIESDKELDRLRNKATLAEVDAMEREIKVLKKENATLKTKDNKSKLENDNLRRTNDRLLKEVSRMQTQLGENNRLLKMKELSRPKIQSEVKETKKNPKKIKIQNGKKSADTLKKKRRKSLKSNIEKVEEEKPATLEIKEENPVNLEVLEKNPVTVEIHEENLVTLEVKKEILDDVQDTNVSSGLSTEENSAKSVLESAKSLPTNFAPKDLKIEEEIMLEEIRDEIKMEISDDDFGAEDQH